MGNGTSGHPGFPPAAVCNQISPRTEVAPSFLGKVGMEQWVRHEVSCSYGRMESQQLLRETEFVPETGEVCLLRQKSRKLYNERSLVIASGW